jgi:hypothetical protein
MDHKKEYHIEAKIDKDGYEDIDVSLNTTIMSTDIPMIKDIIRQKLRLSSETEITLLTILEREQWEMLNENKR